MFRNMVTSLLREERVETTVVRAKEARRVAERMITYAKRGDLHARRQVARVVRDPAVVRKLFAEIGPRFAERPGGYTRILKTGFRNGDNAPLSILELLPEVAHPHAHAADTAAEEKGKKAEATGKGKKEKGKSEAKTRAKAKTKGKGRGGAGGKAGAKKKSKAKSGAAA
jgi:large subunit ribosomal protein L17